MILPLPGWVAWPAAGLALAGFAGYARDTWTGRAAPNRVSWVMWASAASIAAAAGWAQGLPPRQVAVTAALGLGPAVVALLALRVPAALREPLSGWHWCCGFLSALALGAWLGAGRGRVAVILAVGADLAAALPTIGHAWADPDGETPGTYLASATAAVLAMATLPQWGLAAWFPAYAAAVCALIAALVVRPRRKHWLFR